METTTTGLNSGVLLALWGVSVVIWIVLIWATVHIAGKKSRSKFGWGVFAFFIPILALIIVAVLGPNPKATPPTTTA